MEDQVVIDSSELSREVLVGGGAQVADVELDQGRGAEGGQGGETPPNEGGKRGEEGRHGDALEGGEAPATTQVGKLDNRACHVKHGGIVQVKAVRMNTS